MGTILYNDALITSRVQQSLYVNIMHSQFVTWYSGKYDINSALMNDEIHWKSFILTPKENRFGMNIFHV